METKICSKCGRELSVDCFGKQKLGKNGLTASCKECNCEYSRKHSKENPNKEKARYKKYHENNKEKDIKYRNDNKERIAERQSKWYAVNKTSITECHKKYNQKNKVSIAEQQKQYEKVNKKPIAERRARYYEVNKETISERQKQYYEVNKESISKHSKQYKQDNRDKFNIYTQKRRALQRGLSATLTVRQWEDVKLHFDNKCCYCGKELPLTQEHFVPVKKGGEYTINNIIPSCMSCNLRKSTKNFSEWYPKFRHYSKKREKIILEFLNYKDGAQQIALTV